MRRLSVAAGLAAILSLAACSSFVGGDLVRAGEPVGQILLVNDSGIPINVATVSRCSAMSYGLNTLNSGEVIPSGGRRVFTVNAGCWDVGAGRTGSCSGGRCGWNEAYSQVRVPADGTAVARFTPAGG
jgi:hypothetical protein